MKLTLEKTLIKENRRFDRYTIGRYEVDVTTYEYGNKHIYFGAKDQSTRFLPCIYCKDDFEGHILGFEIQTTSYGALSADEIKQVIAGYNEALKVVEILTKEFVK